MFRCYHCPQERPLESSQFEDIIKHSIDNHPHHPLSVRRKHVSPNSTVTGYRSIHFKHNDAPIIPQSVLDSGHVMKCEFICEQWKIIVSLNEQNSEQHLQIKSRSVACQTDQTFLSSKELEKAADLLPQFVDEAKENGQLSDLLYFLKLYSYGVFPSDNIAFLLFLDVVRWFGCENTCSMRYSETVKTFWKTGVMLFKGRFLRFMSGLKNQGQLVSNTTEKGFYSPENSKVNFAVPSRNTLDVNEQLSEECESPGVMLSVLDSIAAVDRIEPKTYKLSVDLKKLNYGGSNGDVNMWGFEKNPTLTQRKNRLQQENETIENLLKMTKEDQNSNINLYGDAVSVLSGRIQDLREMRVKKQYIFDKHCEEAGPNWMNGKHALYLSSLQTTIYKTDTCIRSLLTETSLSLAIASANHSKKDFQTSMQVVDLDHQSNYVCLIGLDEDMVSTNASKYSPFIKQRSQLWQQLRKDVHVTGSTAFKALGLDTLKAQVEHFETKCCGKPEPPRSPELEALLNYGTENEINAVATLVSKVLPVYYPDLLFFEEGCYIMERNGRSICIVSPDGSLRTESGRTALAVEIKCPNPNKTNKTFQPTVMYRPPRYYILQLLLEMKVLHVSQLLFVCYTPATTTVMRVQFSTQLWEKVWNLMTELYGTASPKKPTRLHPSVKGLRSDIKSFIDTNVTFLCEVESAKALPCRHLNLQPSESDDIFGHHDSIDLKTQFSNLMKVDNLYQLKEYVKMAYDLTRHLAKQILVIMISDLDRHYKPEVPHAAPVAYALTDNSAQTNK